MRKYHQLLLLIIAFASLSLFLIYRNEYNRLHYILEVLNFFGQPCNFSALETDENIINHHDWGPTPLWQENENLSIYSAFWTNKNEVAAIVAQRSNQSLARNCYLWYEDRKKPILGKLRFSKLTQDEANILNVYFYYCAMRNIEETPYAVSFSVRNRRVSHTKRILLTNNMNHKPNINMTICVAPTSFNKTKFIEFISFHKLIGIDSYIVYGGTIPHRFSKLLENLSHRLYLHITFFPWNFPSTENSLARAIITEDCILRNRNESNFTAVLDIDEYIVPSKYASFNDIIDSIAPTSHKFALPLLRFCVENVSPDKPIALQNVDASESSENSVINVYRVNSQYEAVSVQKFDMTFAAVNKYARCSRIEGRRFRDTTILKFSTDFIRSTLMQLLKNDLL